MTLFWGISHRSNNCGITSYTSFHFFSCSSTCWFCLDVVWIWHSFPFQLLFRMHKNVLHCLSILTLWLYNLSSALGHMTKFQLPSWWFHDILGRVAWSKHYSAKLEHVYGVSVQTILSFWVKCHEKPHVSAANTHIYVRVVLEVVTMFKMCEPTTFGFCWILHGVRICC